MHGQPSIKSILRFLFFIIFRNDLPLTINPISEPILIVDETSVIISTRNFEDFCSVSILVLNLVKTNITKFISKNSANSTLHNGYKEKYIKETVNTEFLSLQIYNHLNLNNYIEEMIPKWSITSGR